MSQTPVDVDARPLSSHLARLATPLLQRLGYKSSIKVIKGGMRIVGSRLQQLARSDVRVIADRARSHGRCV